MQVENKSTLVARGVLKKHWRKLTVAVIVISGSALFFAGWWLRPVLANWQPVLLVLVLIGALTVITLLSLWVIWVVPQKQVGRLQESAPKVSGRGEKTTEGSAEVFAPWELDESGELTGSNAGTLKPKELFELENEARKTLAQIVGGVLVILGLVVTGANLWITQREAERNRALTLEGLLATQRDAERNRALTLEGQIIDRFTAAIAQLRDEKLEVRLVGIYALERIAKDSPKDYWTIMEVLTAYVREKSPLRKSLPQTNKNSQESSQSEEWQPIPKLATDIQAVLTVIGRRSLSYGKGEEYRLDLRDTDLRGANFSKAKLGGANLSKSDLSEADLSEADLSGADLSKAKLGGASLWEANLCKALLYDVDLRKTSSIVWEQLDCAHLPESTQLPPEFAQQKQERLKRRRDF